MKINSYCYERTGMWYFRKRIPFQLNKKTPIYRISLKKLLGKKSYYNSLLNASLFTIANYINNQVELLFLKVESLSLEELNELKMAYDTDNIGLYRKKARDIINRQNIITQEEISKIPENMIQTFEENLVKKEMEVILQDIANYDNLLNKKSVVNASSDLIAF